MCSWSRFSRRTTPGTVHLLLFFCLPLASPVDNDSTNSVLNTAAIERLAYGEKPRFEQGLDHVYSHAGTRSTTILRADALDTL
jgi:hypothetical protein